MSTEQEQEQEHEHEHEQEQEQEQQEGEEKQNENIQKIYVEKRKVCDTTVTPRMMLVGAAERSSHGIRSSCSAAPQ